MNMQILFLIAGMCAVTYIPRFLPSLFIGKIKLTPKVEKFLKLIPYTAMTALIFPGVLGVSEGNIWIGAAGAAVAILLSLIKKIPPAFAVIGAVLVVGVLNVLFEI